MKKIILFVLLIAAVQLYAQDVAKRNHPFQGKIHSSGYGALSTQYSKFDGKDAIFAGAYGGWMINHKVVEEDSKMFDFHNPPPGPAQ